MRKLLRTKALLFSLALLVVGGSWALTSQAAAAGELVTVYKSPT